MRSKAASVGNLSLAEAFFARLINPDSGARRVLHHSKASAHTFRAVTFRRIDDSFFHLGSFGCSCWRPIQPTISLLLKHLLNVTEP
jgi:hypothetical protein